MRIYLQSVWGISSVGRALAWHARGHRFESGILHQKIPPIVGFFYAAMFVVYILYSVSSDKYYIGSCEDLSLRINQHNTGRNISTKNGLPWIIRYTEQFETRIEALRREKEIKNKKSRKYIDWLISSVE